MRRLLLAIALLSFLGSLACSPVVEDLEVTRARQANELSRDLMSPFCPGRTLADCSSPDAGAVRQEIREALKAGDQPDEIRARIEARFGDHVVGVPRQLLGWLFPILVLIAGAGGLVWVLRRAVQSPAAATRALSPELEARLARELDELDPR
jgi:cytochrome c-type biogenesis protein CcmH/NrfF